MVDKISSFNLQVTQTVTPTTKTISLNANVQEVQLSPLPDQVSSSNSNKGTSTPVINFVSTQENISNQVASILQLTQKDLEILRSYNVGIVNQQGKYYFTLNGKIVSPDDVYRHLQAQKEQLKSQLNQTKQIVDTAVDKLQETIDKNWRNLTQNEQSSVSLQINEIVRPNYRAFNIRYQMIVETLNR